LYGFSDIEDINGNKLKLNEINDLEEGDRITKINGEDINSIEDLKEKIFQSNGDALNVEIVNNERKYKKYRFNAYLYRK
jgi:membrane-associated protease RseP (regulator of RpoE activity)